jgi:transitional endoplasmic reticulum ATPase
MFRKARQASPCILFFDEFDSLVPERGLSSDSQVAERVISQFLTELDGLEELKGVLVLAATNRKDLIDSAILRPGRFDFILEFSLPEEKARLEIFRVHTKGKPLASDVDLPAMAQKTEGMAGSDIAAICQEASMIAIREFIKVGHKENKLQIAPKEQKSGKTLKDSIEFAAKLQISSKHFDLAIQWLKGQKGE